MIKLNQLKGVLYPRCTSIEIDIDNNNKSIRVISIDSQEMRKVFFTEENEIIESIVIGTLDLYLDQYVYISNALISKFVTKFIKKSDTTIICYSDYIIDFLIENKYEEGITKEALDYFKR